MLRPYHSVRIGHRRHALLAPDGGAPFVHHDVDGEPVQPRAERALAAKRTQLVPGAHEHILCALLRGARVPGKAQAQGVHASRKLTIEILERRLIASLRSADELVRHVAKMPPGTGGFGGSITAGGSASARAREPRGPSASGRACRAAAPGAA